MEESFAPTPKKLPLATSNLAQLIVSWDNGQDGVIVIRLAEKDYNKEQDVLPQLLPSVEKHVKVELKSKPAIPHHAQ